MSNDTTHLAINPDQSTWSDIQIGALKALGVDATRADMEIFFHVVKRTGLDPFAKQIYMLPRQQKNKRTQQWETKWSIQTGIDGYRVTARRAADRTRESFGIPETLWCGPDGKWKDAWLPDEPPAASKVIVTRNGQPFTAVARFSEYTGGAGMWARMPANQIAKCAEALALRKAFPADLSGVYVDAEMEQAALLDEPTVVESPPAAALGEAADAPARDWLADLALLTELGQVQGLWSACTSARQMTPEIADALTKRADELRPAAEMAKTPQPATGGKVKDTDHAAAG